MISNPDDDLPSVLLVPTSLTFELANSKPEQVCVRDQLFVHTNIQ